MLTKKVLFALLFISVIHAGLMTAQSGGTVIPIAPKKGQALIDSLLAVIPKSILNNKPVEFQADTSSIKNLITIAYEYHRIDPDEGIKYANIAMDHSKAINWKKGMASAGNRLGLCHWAKADFPKSLEYHFEALKLSEEINEKEITATIHGNIGLVYADQQQYEKALQYHFKSMEMNAQLNNKSGVARNLGNIGIVYDAQGEFEKALEYYFKAVKEYELLSDKGGIARNLGNIGFAYQEQKNYTKALEYYLKALPMNEELGNKILMAQNLGNMGEAYYHIATESAIDSEKKNAMTKSEMYLTKSIAIFEDLEDPYSLQELYLYLSDLNLLSGNYKEGMAAYKKHIASRDSVFNEDNKRKIAGLEKTREEDLKQKEIEIKDLQLLKASDQKRFMLIGLVLLACLAGLIYNRYLFKQKSNIQLSKTLEELKNTQAQLVQSERMAAFGVMATRVAHEIMNPLNFINNFSEIAVESLHDINNAKDESEKQEIMQTLLSNMNKITQHGKRAESIVTQLLVHTRKGTAHQFFEGER